MRNKVFFYGAAAAAIAVGVFSSAHAASFPDPPKTGAGAGTQSIVLAGGCFWGMQGIYEHVKGVTNTVVGYAGGKKDTAHYDRIEEGDTNHAESVKVTFDPSQISYGDLLKVYFSVAHDPTTLNRQHYDVGPQYRSAIFYSDEEQKKIAESYIRDLNTAKVFKSPIVTQVVPLQGFYTAEEHHQHFLDRNPTQGYIVAVDIPLLKAFQEKYPEYYKR
jgi:peptide-methionine (S)-S-oxide reductase